MYYDWSKIEGYNCPVKIVVGQRGLGKTFAKLKQATERVALRIKNEKRGKFIYVVETGDMVKELTRNDGEKFWVALMRYYEEQDTSRKRFFFDLLTELKLVDEEEEDAVVHKRVINTKLIGGTIKINGETAGYIVDLNSFGKLKRNNFNDVDIVIIDEFISETLDKTTLDNPRKVASIIQSIGRTRDIKIYLLGNSVRLDDPILARLGFKLNRFGFHKIYDKHGLLAVLHFVDPSEYKAFNEVHNASVAGRFSKMLGETHEEENKFVRDLPDNRRLVTPCKYKKDGVVFNIVKGDTIVTLRELSNGNIACVPFSGRARNLFCMTEKEQGFKLGFHIICNKALRQIIMNMLKADIVHYYSEIEYNQLKLIIKGD